jgi:hypothetical protein
VIKNKTYKYFKEKIEEGLKEGFGRGFRGGVRSLFTLIKYQKRDLKRVRSPFTD